MSDLKRQMQIFVNDVWKDAHHTTANEFPEDCVRFAEPIRPEMPEPKKTYADHSSRAYSREQMVQAMLDAVELYRRTQPEATAPEQDLSAAMTAKQCLELETIGAEWMSESGREVLADWIEKQTASSANALSAGDRVDAERYRWYRSCGAERDQLAILDARGNIIPEELDAEIDARLAAILQSQKDGHG